MNSFLADRIEIDTGNRKRIESAFSEKVSTVRKVKFTLCIPWNSFTTFQINQGSIQYLYLSLNISFCPVIRMEQHLHTAALNCWKKILRPKVQSLFSFQTGRTRRRVLHAQIMGNSSQAGYNNTTLKQIIN